jgi:2Fe-2S ferredoxin
MPKLTFLPHPTLCPHGKTIEVKPGISILNAALANGIELEHVCEQSCACTTCHVIIRQGFDSLTAASEREEDLLDRAWGLEPESRLSCQAIVTHQDLLIDIPKYTVNMVAEKH